MQLAWRLRLPESLVRWGTRGSGRRVGWCWRGFFGGRPGGPAGDPISGQAPGVGVSPLAPLGTASSPGNTAPSPFTQINSLDPYAL